MLFSFNQGAEWNALTLQTAHINTLYCQCREEDKPRHCVCIRPSPCVSPSEGLGLSQTYCNLHVLQDETYISIQTALCFVNFTIVKFQQLLQNNIILI